MRGRAVLLGLGFGAGYGLLARFAATFDPAAFNFGVMTVGFIFVVPVVVGYLTVQPVPEPSTRFRIFAPWGTMLLVVLGAAVVGWEGAICIAMALPVLLVLSSLGGYIGGMRGARHPAVMSALLVLPYVVAPAEHGFTPPRRITETVTEIRIAAPPERVWPLVASVDSIRPEEQRRALFTTLGFPRPISATLSRPGVGGVRTARFENGLVFTETVTDWQPNRRLGFTIRANTGSIPPGTLDPHVTIGGPYFDVLTGTYELHPTPDGGTRLVLHSRHRVSTRFNVYAGWWANAIMRSIQANILEVHRRRAERAH